MFRDYGLYDHAMLRFKAGSKLAENFYVRQDGTRSYFFTDGKIAGIGHDFCFLNYIVAVVLLGVGGDWTPHTGTFTNGE